MRSGGIRNFIQISTSRRSSKFSTLLAFLTTSLLTLRADTFRIHRFSLQPLQQNKKSCLVRMSASKTVKAEDPVASDTPTKLLLHEKDGTSFPRDITGTKPFPSVNGLKIISWNVAGLRGTLKKSPEVLHNLVDEQQPDLLCLQETKLQNIGDFGDLLADRGYKGYWTYSEVKKGYAGTVIFVREKVNPNTAVAKKEMEIVVEDAGAAKKKLKKQAKLSAFFETKASDTAAAAAGEGAAAAASTSSSGAKKSIPEGTVEVLSVVYHLPDSRFNGEGRWVQVETPDFFFVNCYVPNSGQNLERLDFRVDEWEPYVTGYLNQLRESKPVIYSGDLNVAHTDLDVYNFQAKHLLKQAGTTLREKNSFSALLATGYQDALRYFYPAAGGQFTYWSQRTRARPFNKGLRLDYFVCSQEMFEGCEKGEGAGINVGAVTASSAVEGGSEIEKGASSSSAKPKGRKRKTDTPDVAPVEAVVVEDRTSEARARQYDNPRGVRVLDSYILADANDCSDHCPVVLTLQVTP